jgi:hypothetical protein
MYMYPNSLDDPANSASFQVTSRTGNGRLTRLPVDKSSQRYLLQLSGCRVKVDECSRRHRSRPTTVVHDGLIDNFPCKLKGGTLCAKRKY